MADITRRSFLEHSLMVAAAGLASSQVARGEDRQTEAAASGPKAGANEKIGIAVIGLHGRGMSHLEAYTYDDNVDIVALCDVDENQFGHAQAKLQDAGRPRRVRREARQPQRH